MELRFDASQNHQLAAINATVGVLEGQPFVLGRLTIPTEAHFQVVANHLDLEANELLANVRTIQAEAGLGVSDVLDTVVAKTDTLHGPQTVAFPNFSIEMETGTGKTYVYLRTALEMFTRFGLRKFIVVVPSVAVREGVMKTLAMTKAHLESRYGPYRFNVYDSNSPARLRNFCLSDGLEFLVMTIDSFTSAGNVIRQSKDGRDPPIYQLQATRPVLILDEPQNLETDIRKAALASLNPLFALRYSATHKNSYTLIHRLTPYDAYRQGLVKRIEVASVVEADNANLPFVRVDEIVARKKTLSATLSVHKRLANGSVRETAITVRPSDDLAIKTDRADYEGFIVDEINLAAGFVRFENGVEVRLGSAVGTERESIIEAQIRYTIEEHFRKQRRLRDLDLKVLSLFFIDKVDNYVPEDSLLRTMFVKAFDDLKVGYPEWAAKTAHQVQASYFASKTRKGGSIEVVDTTTGTTKEDEAAFNLIMREKEKLLSFEEPVAFIFSHSALREGWDNPNVFQICTLREVGSEAERRQQVGRGVRLPVTQAGERLNDDRANVLTVIASESYERFVAGLQSEIEAAYGKTGTPPPPADKRRQVDLKLRKAHMLKPEFQALWDQIKYRTRYSVTIDTEALVSAVLLDLDAATIRSPRIVLTKGEMHVSPTEEMFEAIQQSGARTAVDLAGRYPLPNLVEVMEFLMETTSPPMRLTRRTLLEIYRRTANKEAAISNPHAFAVAAINIIKEKLADQLVAGIRYEKDGNWYEMSQFAEVISSYADRVVSSEASSKGGGTHLYDRVPIDSETVERPFAAMLENRLDVKLYIKLPRWFEVDTPVGKYNPDWAVVMDDPEADGETVYLVRETKGGESLDDLRPAERRKIACGKAHFVGALDVNFDVSRPPFGPSSLP